MASIGTSVQDFLANFTGGGLRPNRYQIVLSFPNDVLNAVGGGTTTANKISFTCKTSEIPASTLGVVELPFMGRQVKMAGDKTFDDWTITVMLDTDLIGRHIFEAWHNQIMGFDSNVSTNAFVNPSNYFASGVVTLLDRAGDVLETYVIESIFPTQVGSVALGFDQNDQIAEQQVTFAVNGWSNSFTS
jgi:hypothetical protein